MPLYDSRTMTKHGWLIGAWVGCAGGCSNAENPSQSQGPGDGTSTSLTGEVETTDFGDSSAVTAGGDGGAVELPPANAGLDYQLGGAYDPPGGVEIVVRDRSFAPASGLYNVCYVNGFQAQPDEANWWLNEHPELVLRDTDGMPVIDPDWDEMLLDTSTSQNRESLAAIVNEWIVGCADDGYQAVEIDNLDSYTRSEGLLNQDDAVTYMALLSRSAHGRGLAIAQKNSAEILDRVAEMSTDFAVVEECNRYTECDEFITAYPDAVLMVEYRRQDFAAGCANYPQSPIVLRDLDLLTPGEAEYVYEGC